MAKLHRRRPDSRASGITSRQPNRPRPVPDRSPGTGARRAWSLPHIHVSRLIPGRLAWMNLAVGLCAAWCLYQGFLWGRTILARPAVTKEKSVVMTGIPEFERVPEGLRIRVEVLNGCGVAGIAGHLTDKLREQNFDVVYEGNYKSNDQLTFNIRETIVVDRIGIPGHAQRVAAFLGTTNVIQQARSDSLLDVSIILGRDYQDLNAFR